MSIHTSHPVPAAHHEARPVQRQAQRAIIRDHRDTARPVVRYERPVIERHIIARPAHPIIERSVYVTPAAYWTPSPAYTVAPQPLQLLAPTSLASDQLTIDTGSLGAATALELDAAGGGSTYVSQLVLVDVYGATQAIPVNQVLSPQNPSIQLPLAGGSSIARVIIDGHSDWGGQVAMRAL